MTSPHLPPAVVTRLASKLDGAGRASLKSAQHAMSAIYRDGGHSRQAVPDATAALAYAIARMPATYAACVRAFDLAAAQMPDFAPQCLLDFGAGPGTAALAAAAVWPSLSDARLIEPHAALSAIAADIVPATTRLQCQFDAIDLAKITVSPPVDLITLSYVLAEQPEPQIATLMTRIAALAGGMIIIAEPGTPQGYARVLAARDALSGAGLTILAPCPHANRCPLPANDWCHFSVRLQRSATHMHLKDANVPFEDERFSFVAAVRGNLGTRAAARLIRPAVVEKGFADLALCTADGLETRRVRRRDTAAYKAAKSLAWGDTV